MGKRNKYKVRADGRRETTKTYTDFGPSLYCGKKHFYGKTDEDVDKQISDFENALLLLNGSNSRTFEEVGDAWWKEKEPQLSPNNIRSYQAHLNNAIADFGNTPVSEITAKDIIAHLKKISVKGYSQKVIKNRKTVIKAVLNQALADGDITSNPCNDIPIIKGKPAEEREPASDADILKIEATKNESNFSRMMYFMEYTGCRRGEAVALQEKHIDREHYKATICQSVAYREQEPELKLPKTKAGIREIDLYDNVLEILPEYKDKETFVFFPEGLPRKGALERGLKKYQKDNGITSTAHQLRHSYASMLHTAKVDVKNAQHLLGHSSVIVTEDIYTKIEAQNKAEVRNQVNRFVMDRLGEKQKCCPECGSRYISAEDGHVFSFCPDCRAKLESKSSN